jgi:hypothetical protein
MPMRVRRQGEERVNEQLNKKSDDPCAGAASVPYSHHIKFMSVCGPGHALVTVILLPPTHFRFDVVVT